MSSFTIEQIDKLVNKLEEVGFTKDTITQLGQRSDLGRLLGWLSGTVVMTIARRLSNPVAVKIPFTTRNLNDFYQSSTNQWISDQFRKSLLKDLPAVSLTARTYTIQYADIIEKVDSSGIGHELGGDHLFEKRDLFLNLLATLVENQSSYKETDGVLTPSGANIFHVKIEDIVYVVLLRWRDGSAVWDYILYPPEQPLYTCCKGDRVFFPGQIK